MAVIEGEPVKASWRESILVNAWPLILVALLLIGGSVLSRLHGFELNIALYRHFWTVLNVAGLGVILAVAFAIDLVRSKPHDLVGHLRRRAVEWQLLRRALIAVPIMLIAPALFSAFSSIKSGIPVMNPYYLDPLFMQMDQVIHGTDPWRLMRPLLETPWAMLAINVCYHLWFFLFYAALALASIMVRDIQLRNQFLVAFILCWIGLGLVAATQLSSVGPVYFGDFYPHLANPFAEQMAILRATDQVLPIWALDVQATLLSDYHDGTVVEIGGGISAMPSLHVSISVLMALFAWRVSRALGIAAVLFAAVIMVGSVALAWHYAVDGYLSIALTPLIWWVSGWLVAARPTLAARALRPSPAGALAGSDPA